MGQGEGYVRRHPKASRRATSVRRRGGRLSRGGGRLGLALVAALTLALVVGVALAAAVAPTVTIDNAFAVTYTSAHATGKVDPQGQTTSYRFQYISDAQLQENIANGFAEWEFAETAKEEAIEGAEQPVEADLTNLRPATTYHLRLVAENADGSTEAVAGSTFETEATVPPSVSIDAPTNVTATTVDLSGAIDPEAPAGNPSAFDANWRFECNPGCNSAGGTVAADSISHPISETIVGLEPNTTYEIKLFAFNAGSEIFSAPVTLTTEGVGPAVQTLYAGQVHEGSAVLAGRVNPENSATTYQFEWGATASYGNVTPVAAQPLGASDRSFHVVTAPIGGLAAGTTYHFRVVATNTETGGVSRGEDRALTTTSSAAPPTCPNAEVRTGKSQKLPDCRAYEQVSPREKEYGVLSNSIASPFIALSAREDGRVMYATAGAFPGSYTGGLTNLYLSDRSGGSWSLQPLTPPENPIPGANHAGQFGGLTPDLRFTTVSGESPALVPGAIDGNWNLYLQDNLTGGHRLVSLPQELYGAARVAAHTAGISDDGSHVAFDWGSAEELYEWSGTTLSKVGEEGAAGQRSSFGNNPSSRWFNGMSADGRRLVYVQGNSIMVRENGTRLIEANSSQRSVPDPGESASSYWGSSSDGNVVLFTSANALTNDATIGGGEQLYAFHVDSGVLTDLDADASLTDPEGPRVLGVVGQSEDASYVYFVARGDLGGNAVSGAPNLYLWHDGAVRFIASLDEADAGNWARETPEITSEVTPDGLHVLLTAKARLTGYDNLDQATGQPDPEIYSYDAGSEQIVCASCRPDGAAPEGGSAIKPYVGLSFDRTHYYQRYVTDDGGRVVWSTSEAVLPSDVNGKPDVYEYSEGGLKLLSSGTGEFETNFADMSASGADVYFATREQLVKSDTDGFPDLYDARVGGGFAEPPKSLPPCSGGECVRAASTPPAAVAIGSTGLQGKGNQRPARHCPKGKRLVRRHGKQTCVKKTKSKKQKSKKKHKSHKQKRGAGSARGGSK
jgi:hypothetical protein